MVQHCTHLVPFKVSTPAPVGKTNNEISPHPVFNIDVQSWGGLWAPLTQISYDLAIFARTTWHVIINSKQGVREPGDGRCHKSAFWRCMSFSINRLIVVDVTVEVVVKVEAEGNIKVEVRLEVVVMAGVVVEW